MTTYTSLILDDFPYKQIQEIAKGLGVPANKKKSILIQLILDAQVADELVPEENEEEATTMTMNASVEVVDDVPSDDVIPSTSSVEEPATEEISEQEEDALPAVRGPPRTGAP